MPSDTTVHIVYGVLPSDTNVDMVYSVVINSFIYNCKYALWCSCDCSYRDKTVRMVYGVTMNTFKHNWKYNVWCSCEHSDTTASMDYGATTNHFIY